MKNPFVDHPYQHGETYWQHMHFAVIFSLKLIGAGLACMLHAIFPFVFKTRASDTVFSLVKQFAERIPEAQHRIVNLAKPYLMHPNTDDRFIYRKAFNKRKTKAFFRKKLI